MKLGRCPNNCDFTVTPGDGGGGSTGGGGIGWIPVYTTCPYCYKQYDTSFPNCPYCDGRRCSSCGQYPCVCVEDNHRCDLCVSQHCPGPWVCGGGGNQGGELPQPIAPKAKAIFRNSNMTDKNWGVIERMLDKITADCMEKALYNGLKNALKGKTIIIQFTNKNYASFTFNGTSAVELRLTAESNELFHEMWHTYQAYQENKSTFLNSLINQEIEAHYAQYLYLQKLPEYKNNKWEKYYSNDQRMATIKNLKQYINEKGHLHSNADINAFNSHFLITVSIFEITPGYHNYKYDETRTGLINFSNLRILTKDC